MKLNKIVLAIAATVTLGACSTTNERIRELEERTLPDASIEFPTPPAELLIRPAPLKPIPNTAPVQATDTPGEPQAEIPVSSAE